MPRPAQGPNYQEAHLPQPAWRFNLQEAVTPQPAWRFNLQEAVTPQPAWDLHCDLVTPGFQVVTVLGRISFKMTHP